MKQLQQCTLSYTPPGFRQTIDIPFPAKGLSVCEKCKKNFKTRELCRHRYGHTDLPTGLTYICITLDSSCTNPDGSITDQPLIAQWVPRQPYLLRKESNGSLPICSVCKEKNYTRAYCRKKLSHKMLPWNTNYVVLSTNYTNKFNEIDFEENDSHTGKRRHPFYYKSKKDNLDLENQGEGKKNRIINICNAPSRTFLAQVRVDLNKVEWLEHDHSFAWESGKCEDKITSNENKGSVPSSSDTRAYARSNVLPKFGSNTIWESTNNNNDYHGRDNQYTASYSNQHAVWNQTNAIPEYSYCGPWDMRRYNNMPNNGYDYFSSYSDSNRAGIDANIASTYFSEHNANLPPQLNQNQRGTFDNYSHSGSGRIENMHNRPYDPYGGQYDDADNNCPSTSSYHSSWENNQDRTSSQQYSSSKHSINDVRNTGGLNGEGNQQTKFDSSRTWRDNYESSTR